MSTQSNYVSSSSSKSDRRVRVPTDGGDRETSHRKSTPHPKSLGAYSPPADRPEEYHTDEEDSDAEYASGYDSDGNHVRYMVGGSGRTKVNAPGWRDASSSKPKAVRRSSTMKSESSRTHSPPHRSSTFQEAYPENEYATDSDFSEAEYEEYRNAHGDMEQVAKGENNAIRTITEDSIRRREKDERKAAKLEKKYRKMAKRFAEEEKAGIQWVTDPARENEKVQYRKIKVAEGWAEEATGSNPIGVHEPSKVKEKLPSGTMVRAH